MAEKKTKAKAVTSETVSKEKAPVKAAYTKERILKLSKFADRRDLLSVLLEDKKSYTIEEAQKLINGFMGTKEEK